MSSPRRVDTLPIEIVASVLSAIPDTESLIATLKTCRQFYFVFKQFETSITRAVMGNEIGETLLPEASLRLVSCPHWGWKVTYKIPRADPDDFSINFNLIHLRTIEIWTLKDARRMGSFHAIVRSWAERFVAWAFRNIKLGTFSSLKVNVSLLLWKNCFHPL
jgi:hypothetical protein